MATNSSSTPAPRMSSRVTFTRLEEKVNRLEGQTKNILVMRKGLRRRLEPDLVELTRMLENQGQKLREYVELSP